MDRERTDAKSELIELVSEELKRIRERLAELKVQIDQTQGFVEREQMRAADIAADIRTIQDNIDTVPRQDIKAKFEEDTRVKVRLTTMQGQLEKFKQTREMLETQQVMYSQILNRLQGADAIVADTSTGDGGRSLTNIVRVIQAQEEERERLARQMHDGPAQSLTNFILQAEICQRLFDRNPARAAEELNNLKSAASITFQKVREFIFDLSPMMLKDLGVVPTVRRYVDSFREKNDIEVRLDITGEERRLEPHREVTLFRGIQELMVNARDYASATMVSIKLDMAGTRIRASVEDDGRGFDSDAAFRNSDETHTDPRVQSLITQREKFELVRGSVVVESDEGKGTSVRLELPVSDDTA